MPRKVLVVAAAIAGLATTALAVYAVQFFTPQKSSPSSTALRLASPSSSPALGGSLTGTWKVAAGSSAGYRATEQFAGVNGPNQAVADSTSVSGGMTITDQAGQLLARQLKVVVDLTRLHSSDAAATRGGLQRDRFVGPNFLETDQFPTASYGIDSITIPAAVASGGQQQLTTHGRLTIHGVTRSVDIVMAGQVSGSRIEVVGSVAVDMTDYGVQPPNLQFTSVRPQVTIAFHVFFSRA